MDQPLSARNWAQLTTLHQDYNSYNLKVSKVNHERGSFVKCTSANRKCYIGWQNHKLYAIQKQTMIG